MLVNYTGAAGDLPGEIPRIIGPRGRKIRPLDLWPWSEKLHFVMPGRLRTFGSEPGRTCATHFVKQQSLLLDVLGGSVRGTRSPSLTSFISRISRTRGLRENGFVHQKHSKNKRIAKHPKGIDCLSASKN